MESIVSILTSPEFLTHIPGIILLCIVLGIAVKLGIIRVKTEHIQVGGEPRESFYERTIVRYQKEAAYNFIKSQEHKICKLKGEPSFGGYKTKYILELIYDKAVDWITYNHIEDSDAYIEAKCNDIDSVIYQNDPDPVYCTPEFQERVHRWTRELIIQMLNVRRLYTKQLKEGK